MLWWVSAGDSSSGPPPPPSLSLSLDVIKKVVAVS